LLAAGLGAGLEAGFEGDLEGAGREGRPPPTPRAKE